MFNLTIVKYDHILKSNKVRMAAVNTGFARLRVK